MMKFDTIVPSVHNTIAIIFLIFAYVYVHLDKLPRSGVPSHLSNHPVFSIENLISDDLSVDLMDIIFSMSNYSSNVDQSKGQGFIPKYEHIGEAQPINSDGSCSHKFLFPNSDKTKCILPQRVDIGKHYIMTGGIDGIKESYQELVARVSSFGRYTFIDDIDQYPSVKSLFYSEKFQSSAKQVCPVNKSYLDTFQFNFIIQIPGQTVAVHIDSPYFWGASRFHFPQWLLAAMVFSNLFQDKFVDQVQVVGYLHKWELSDGDTSGGEFVWYNNNTSIGVVSPKPLSGTIVDGSKVFHAAKLYQPTVKAPYLDKNKQSSLNYIGNDQWEVVSGGERLQLYTTADLRISIVYRARCFESEQQASEFIKHSDDDDSIMDLDDILNILKDDLIKRKKLSVHNRDSIDKLSLAFLIMDTYIVYPLPSKEVAMMPYNYCMLHSSLC